MNNVGNYMGQGVTAQTFIDHMTRNQDKFFEWHSQFRWEQQEDHDFFASLAGTDVRCLIIAADWCGDVIRNVPVVLQLCQTADIPVEIFVMEEHLELMDAFLTMGGRSIPVVLFVNSNGDIVGRWGPRPKDVQEVMVQFKQSHPDRNAPDYEKELMTARSEMMRRYGEDAAYQQRIIAELRTLLTQLKQS